MTGSAGTTPTTTENVMIGTLSGANQPSGDFNTYVGNVTGWGCNYDSDNCTYLGMDVFRGSPEFGLFNSGSNNTGVGARVMRNGTFDQCCTLGAFTMQYQNVTATQVTINNSVAIGFGSMVGDPTALGTIANCVSVGWYTGANLGKGMSAGVTVQGNVFVGTAAGRYVQSGNFNTLIGYNAGASSSMTTTAFATCVGASVGSSLTTGNQLTAMGFNAASNLTTGNANNVFGYQTALNLTTGSFNHFFGNSTGSKAVGGNRNTLIGHLAGSNNLVNGSDNIILGYGLDTVGDASSTINIGNTFMATVATGPLSKARIDLAGQSVAYVNSLITPTAQGISIDMPNQVVLSAAVVAGGTGYVINDTLNDAFGGRYQATGVSSGVVTALTVIKPGVSSSPPGTTQTLTNGSKTTSSNQTGSGCTATLTWSTLGTVKAIQLNPSANDVLIGSGTTSNAATVGFLGLPATPGVPTGTPTNAALGPLLVYNKGTDTIDIFANGAWRHIATVAGAA